VLLNKQQDLVVFRLGQRRHCLKEPENLPPIPQASSPTTNGWHATSPAMRSSRNFRLLRRRWSTHTEVSTRTMLRRSCGAEWAATASRFRQGPPAGPRSRAQ
jgi:hypothetical protein